MNDNISANLYNFILSTGKTSTKIIFQNNNIHVHILLKPIKIYQYTVIFKV